LQRRSGRRWRTLATARRTTSRVRLTSGRAVLRAQVRVPGGLTTVSRNLRVRVR
jgi:hypothetical protein